METGDMLERHELYCHNCNQYVRFEMDLSVDGNHVIVCPRCQHEHCRVVAGGKITSDRWDRRNGPTIYCYAAATTATISYYSTSSAASSILTDSWAGTIAW